MKVLEASYQKDLLIRLKQGDEPAFNALYKAYSKPLYLRMLRMVKDKDIADELLQELFIKLWDNRHKVDTEKSFQSFMYTVAQNLVYNYFRKLSSDQSLIQSLLLRGTDHYLNGEQLLENKQASELLNDAINQLSPQRKLVFNLCKVEGKSYEETSRIMGISIATVNSHMTQSLQSIKAYLLKHQDVAFVLMSAYVVGEMVK
ncbi:RNA polymerase sigma factor [Mucilaginibacter paludis]|uniref:RNA polymerase, sigma-24 subunit, ECF subfamily n=1 Tax=Mucilaginibacter paludis DSM 18603 TaxID=714943 RepID=H1Y5D8_9SPHI|nr:sigma-70 family RNA polymerase sigma factor [Mucilaginibacter paludis]EHQ28949.1 RNA polymerase, sigma-24 subunit, ECF subfamily [Mucilaginibacter paludis DSM 18603]